MLAVFFLCLGGYGSRRHSAIAVCLGSILVVQSELFRVCALASWTIGANMQCKLFVAPQLEVAHHFIERCSGRRSSRFEAPATFRATKTPKPLLLNPYQLPAHGLLSCCAPTLSDCMPGTRLAFRNEAFSSRRGVRPHYSRKPSPGLGVAEKCVKGRTKSKCANFGWSVGRPTYIEDFFRARPIFGFGKVEESLHVSVRFRRP